MNVEATLELIEEHRRQAIELDRRCLEAVIARMSSVDVPQFGRSAAGANSLRSAFESPKLLATAIVQSKGFAAIIDARRRLAAERQKQSVIEDAQLSEPVILGRIRRV